MRRSVPHDPPPFEGEVANPRGWWILPLALLLAAGATIALLVFLWNRDGSTPTDTGPASVPSTYGPPSAEPRMVR